MLDNQGVVKATAAPCSAAVKDQYYRDSGDKNITTQALMVRWTLGHRDLCTATTYQYYIDMQRENESDALAHMVDNLPVDAPPPQPHGKVLKGHIMPTPAKAWVMQLGRKKTNNKHTLPQLHPVETLLAVHMASWAVGPGPLVGAGSTFGVRLHHVWVLRP